MEVPFSLMAASTDCKYSPARRRMCLDIGRFGAFALSPMVYCVGVKRKKML